MTIKSNPVIHAYSHTYHPAVCIYGISDPSVSLNHGVMSSSSLKRIFLLVNEATFASLLLNPLHCCIDVKGHLVRILETQLPLKKWRSQCPAHVKMSLFPAPLVVKIWSPRLLWCQFIEGFNLHCFMSSLVIFYSKQRCDKNKLFFKKYHYFPIMCLILVVILEYILYIYFIVIFFVRNFPF